MFPLLPFRCCGLFLILINAHIIPAHMQFTLYLPPSTHSNPHIIHTLLALVHTHFTFPMHTPFTPHSPLLARHSHLTFPHSHATHTLPSPPTRHHTLFTPFLPSSTRHSHTIHTSLSHIHTPFTPYFRSPKVGGLSDETIAVVNIVSPSTHTIHTFPSLFFTHPKVGGLSEEAAKHRPDVTFVTMTKYDDRYAKSPKVLEAFNPAEPLT